MSKLSEYRIIMPAILPHSQKESGCAESPLTHPFSPLGKGGKGVGNGGIPIIPIWGKRYLNPNEGFWVRPPACGGRAHLTGGRPFRVGRQPKRAYMTAIGIIFTACSAWDT